MSEPLSVKPPRRARGVPRFVLYGETAAFGADGLADLLHVESIQSRSRLYRGEIDAHAHAGLYQVVWLARGPVQLALDGAVEQREGPVAVVIPPGTVHAFRFSADSDGHVLTLGAPVWLAADPQADVGRWTPLFARPRVLAWAQGAPEAARLAGLFEQLLAEFEMPEAASPVPLWLARAVLWRLAQAAAEGLQTGSGRHRQRLMARFQALIEQHFLAQWPVSRYAEALGLGSERLNRLVQAEAGCSALALVHARLVREACRRLVYGAAPVARLADELGFVDPAYFSRFFKRHTGMSPRAWRDDQAARRAAAAARAKGAASP